jgi:pimeloyl-ACP methyl ester carboxylesterase
MQQNQQTKKDYFLYNSEFFSIADQEILNNIEAALIPIKTQQHAYKINTRLLKHAKSSRAPILMMHGNGSTCTWATWIKLGLTLHKNGSNVLLIDSPGYGLSGVDERDRVNPKLWLEDGPNMLTMLLEHFGFKKVCCVGFCGGAATIMRTISKFPQYFGSRHVFHNSVISAIPPGYEESLKKNNIKVWVSWCEDPDHQRASVAYKFLNSKRKEKSQNIFLEDIKDDDLPLVLCWSKKMGRNTDDVEIFDVSKGYQDFATDFLDGKQTQFRSEPIFYDGVNPENKQLLNDASKLDSTPEERDIALAIALSLADATKSNPISN